MAEHGRQAPEVQESEGDMKEDECIIKIPLTREEALAALVAQAQELGMGYEADDDVIPDVVVETK